jgi:hypothetical protein
VSSLAFGFMIYNEKLAQEQWLKAVNEHSISIEERTYGFYLYQIRNTSEFLSGKLVVE